MGLDDGHIVGKPKDVFARLQDLRENLEPLGLRLNLGKCRLWGPGIQAEGHVTPVYLEGLARSHPGREVPVVPFGGGCGITAPGRDPLVAPECLRKWGDAVAVHMLGDVPEHAPPPVTASEEGSVGGGEWVPPPAVPQKSLLSQTPHPPLPPINKVGPYFRAGTIYRKIDILIDDPIINMLQRYCQYSIGQE
jgi:hypothetical protein